MNQLNSAIFRAINDSINGRLKSRNVHSEIVFNLSSNNNVRDTALYAMPVIFQWTVTLSLRRKLISCHSNPDLSLY
jgi:hypothetical protein